jgi:hypothetical protein
MANTYFIRLRGNVQGPFDAERLRQLARRGQFTRLHEVSVDGREWKPAGECLDLFSSSAGTMLTLAAAATSGGPLVAVSPAGVLPSGTAADGWYYELGGQAQGPVDLTTVQRLVEQGQVTLHSRVWRPGMANWTPAADVPQLAALLVGRAPVGELRREILSEDANVARTFDLITPEIAEVLADSRKWVLLLSVAGFLVALQMLLLFLGMLVWGMLLRNPRLAALAFFPFIDMILLGIWLWLLWRYAYDLTAAAQTRRSRSLYQSLKVLRAFWVYSSVLAIIFVVALIFLNVLALADMSDQIDALMTGAARGEISGP